SIEDMKESDDLIERILLLEGLPNLQDLGKILIGEEVPEVISSDLTCEYNKRTVLVEAIRVCEEKEDYVSRDLLSHLLDESEEHIDYLETQQELLAELGAEKYHQSII
ncbi:MAG: bacterioferritin, partial [Wohlfahrtiimonas sp.]